MANASAQYAIDIAARMSGVEQTTAQLDKLTAELMGGGKDAAFFSESLAQTAAALADAAAASADADAKLKAGNDRFRELEKSAAEAAIAAEKAANSNAQVFAERAERAASKAQGAVERYSTTLDGLRVASDASAAALKAAQADYASLSDSAAQAADAAAQAADANGGAIPDDLVAKARAAAAALDASGAKLRAASEAANASKTALKDGSARYAELERAASKAADAAAKAAAKSVADAQAKQETATAAAEAKAEVDAYGEELKQLAAAAKAASAEEERLSATSKNLSKLHTHVKNSLGDSASRLSAFRGALGDVGGPLGELGERALYPAQAFVDLKEKFGSTAAASTVAVVGMAAVAAAAVALAAAVVVAAVGLAAWAVGLADSARSAGLAAEAFEQLNPKLAGTSGMIRDMAASTGLGEDALRGMAKSITDAKVKAADLPAALEAAAIAERALGAGGANQFLDQVKKSRKSVKDLAADTKSQLGGLAARQMMSLGAQSVRLETNIAGIFSGLNIDSVLEGMKVLVDMFDKNSAAGKSIKFLFETVFQPIIDNAKKAAYVIEAFALGFLIGVTKLYISLKPYIKQIAEFFGFEDTSLGDTLDIVAKAAEFLAGVFAVGAAVVGGVLLVAFGALAIAIGAQVAVWYGLWKAVEFVWGILSGIGSAIKAVGEWLGDAAFAAVEAFSALWDSAKALWDQFSAMSWSEIGSAILSGIVGGISAIGSTLLGVFSGAIDSVRSFFAGLDFGSIGSNIMQGLANGLTGGAGVVLSAIRGAISGAIDGAKAMLGIHSPSTVFAGIGDSTVAGYAEGVDEAAPGAHAAVADMVEPPAAVSVVPPPAVAPAAPLALVAQPAAAVAAAPSVTVVAPQPPPAVTGEVPPINARPLGSDAAPVLSPFDALGGAFGTVQPLAPAPAPVPAQSTKPSVAVKLDGVTFNFYGVEGAEQAEARFSETLTRLLEGDAASLGTEATA